MQSYYPCQDEFWPRTTIPDIAEDIIPVAAGIYQETVVLKTVADDYLVNNDPSHCHVTECKIYENGVQLTDAEFIWPDKDYIYINADPREEFYFEKM